MEIEVQSVSSIYKQENLYNLFTDMKIQDQKSLIKIGQKNQYLRALPLQTSGFYKYFFLCLFNIFKQWHVIYFIVFVLAKTFYLCQFLVETMVVEVILIVIYLLLEVILRYKTYRSYVITEEELKQNKFQVWSKQQQKWEQKGYSELKPGQIIKIMCTEQKIKIVNPVNVLPIYLPSKRNHFQLKTTKLNKFQEVKQIPLFHVFRRINSEENNFSKILERLQKIKIFYEYTIQNSDVFQGRIKVSQRQTYYISNKLILPQGVPIIGQEYIVGVILINFSNIKQKSLKGALNAENKTTIKMGKTLFPLAGFFLLIAIVTFLAEFLIIVTSGYRKNTLDAQYQTILCLGLNILALTSHFIYIAMFIFLLIHRLRDSYILKKKSQIFIKNYIKSIDEFGQTNTIIMDDFFFIDKNLFVVEQMLYDLQGQISLDQQLVFSIIQKSERLKQEMADLWISAFRYFRDKPRRYTKIQTQYKIQIMKEKIFKQSLKYSTITLIAQIQKGNQHKVNGSQIPNSNKYVFRFTQNPKHTTIQRIKDQRLKATVKNLVKDKNLLHIMIEVMQVDISSFDLDNEGFQLISRNYQPTKFEFLALICSKINPNKKIFPLTLIKNQEIVKKQNLIILSTKKWKYIEMILEKNSIDTSHIVSLQEKQSQNVKYDIEHHLRQLRQMNSFDQKHAILAIHCNLVTYLTRPQIIRGLVKLARYSKYIIFHDCSQYQKQVCCMNLFEIFPLHIYLSNYLCDLQLIQKSNLSVCQKGQSTEPYVTLVVKNYKDLRHLILNEAVESINITVFINQILIITIILTEFMLYEGEYFVLGVQFTGIIFITYNLITSLPVLYYVLFRPQIWEEPIYKNNDPNKLSKLQYISERKVVIQFFRAVFIALIITLFNYSFLLSTSIQNMFFSILTSCVVAAGYYQLFIDDARKKVIQVVLFAVLCLVFYIYIYSLQLWNGTGFRLVLIEVNLSNSDTIYFYISNIIVLPFTLGFVFYGMSTMNAKIQPQQNIVEESSSQISSMHELPAKTNQQYGKQLRFRQD